MNIVFSRSAAALAAACAIGLMIAAPAEALDKCKVKIGKTGVIEVSASGVSGTLKWGADSGSETETFFNAATCVAGTTAKGCQLADPATLAAKTPPAGCTLYLDDDGTPCSTWIHGCTPAQPVASAEYADFFALMPADNFAAVPPGSAVSFPDNGPSQGTILRVSPSAFLLAEVGTYEVQFVVSVSEAGQLVVALNGLEVPFTVVGRATGTSLLTGTSIVTTSSANSLLEIRNPSSAATALTITPNAGGPSPASANLVIKKL